MTRLPDPFDFAGTRALVTGGSRGIGAVIAEALAAQGAELLINFSRDSASATATCARIKDGGGRARSIQANLAQPDDVRRLFDEVGADGGLDILVHCAALGSFKPVTAVRSNQWDLTLNVGTRALLLCAQHAAPLLHDTRGRIVSLSSPGSSRVIPQYGAIGVAKAALESLTRYLAVEFAPRGITVNAVSTGLVDHSSIQAHPDFARMAADARARTPVGRLATAADLIPLVLFLCSPASSWVVGQTIVADGGVTLWL
jgi:enoyl-[acyl-carrier protein] reductase III